MRAIALIAFAGRQSPAGLAIAAIPRGIAYTVFVIYQRVMAILLPIIGIAIFEPAWIEPEKRIMRKEQAIG